MGESGGDQREMYVELRSHAYCSHAEKLGQTDQWAHMPRIYLFVSRKTILSRDPTT